MIADSIYIIITEPSNKIICNEILLDSILGLFLTIVYLLSSLRVFSIALIRNILADSLLY